MPRRTQRRGGQAGDITMQQARDYASTLLRSARHRSDLPVTASIDQVARQIRKGCAITGLPLTLSPHPTAYSHPLRPSLDQRRPGKGYTPRNVRVTAWAWNRFKSDLPEKDAVALFKLMAEGLMEDINET